MEGFVRCERGVSSIETTLLLYTLINNRLRSSLLGTVLINNEHSRSETQEFIKLLLDSIYSDLFMREMSSLTAGYYALFLSVMTCLC